MPSPAAKRRRLLLRLGILALLAVSGILLARFTPVGDYLQKERLIELLDQLRHEPWTPLLLVAAYCVFAPMGLPATPLLVGGGVVFGPVLGATYNILGLVSGAMVSYWVGKALGREAVVQLAGPRLRRAERVFERRSFWPLVHIRFLPLPFAAVGFAAALAGVPAMRYFVTSTLGLGLSAVVHTYFAPALIFAALEGRSPIRLTIFYALALLSLNVFAGWPQVQSIMRRRRRYRQLTEQRRERERRQTES